MKLSDIKAVSLGNHPRKRLGRGPRSGHGKTSTRGHKGRGQRSGARGFTGYEGGQTPLFRRLPKRGFNNAAFRLEYAVVNVGDLNGFPAGTEITPDSLKKAGLVRVLGAGLKILGNGALDVPLKVQAHKFSNSAAQKIKEAGGEVKEL
jgi:large subunit ribosomal protein L15